MASGSPNLCQVYYPNGPQYASIVVSFGGTFFVVNSQLEDTRSVFFSAWLWRKWAGLLQHWATDVLAENELVHWWWVAAQVNRLLLASEMIEMKMGSTPRHGNFYWEDPEKKDVFPPFSENMGILPANFVKLMGSDPGPTDQSVSGPP